MTSTSYDDLTFWYPREMLTSGLDAATPFAFQRPPQLNPKKILHQRASGLYFEEFTCIAPWNVTTNPQQVNLVDGIINVNRYMAVGPYVLQCVDQFKLEWNLLTSDKPIVQKYKERVAETCENIVEYATMHITSNIYDEWKKYEEYDGNSVEDAFVFFFTQWEQFTKRKPIERVINADDGDSSYIRVNACVSSDPVLVPLTDSDIQSAKNGSDFITANLVSIGVEMWNGIAEMCEPLSPIPGKYRIPNLAMHNTSEVVSRDGAIWHVLKSLSFVKESSQFSEDTDDGLTYTEILPTDMDVEVTIKRALIQAS
jgi:hypothetical protein